MSPFSVFANGLMVCVFKQARSEVPALLQGFSQPRRLSKQAAAAAAGGACVLKQALPRGGAVVGARTLSSAASTFRSSCSCL